MIFIDIISKIYAYLPTNYYFIVISRIVLAVIIGGIVGFERENKNRPAGFRTHILVCVSSCSLMVLSELLFNQYYSLYGIVIDPQRIAAQVVSGIGFLGAGTIIHYGTSVKGLTTAASIWAVAALGLICGSGFFFLAFFALFIIETVLITFDRYTKRGPFKPKTIELYLTIVHTSEIIGNIMLFLADNKLEVLQVDFQNISEARALNTEENISKIKIILDTKNTNVNINKFISELENQEGVISIKY